MKKLIILAITILDIYLIYSIFNINKINYVIITDINIIDSINKEKLVNYNSFISPSIIKSIEDIKNNKTIQVDKEIYYLKKVLRESDILVINVGMEELANNFNKYNMQINYNYFNKMYFDIKKLIYEVKKYAYGKIIYIGYYNPTNYYDANVDSYFYDMDNKLKRLMKDNDIIYVDLYELVKNNNLKDKNSYYLNKEGNLYLVNSILNYFT